MGRRGTIAGGHRGHILHCTEGSDKVDAMARICVSGLTVPQQFIHAQNAWGWSALPWGISQLGQSGHTRACTPSDATGLAT